MLDIGKSVAEIHAKPEDKYEGTSGLTAFVEHLIGDGGKCSAYLLENLKDPITGRSEEPVHAPANRVHNVNTPLWVWYETPEQSDRRRRFAVAMKGAGAMQPPDIFD
ncbi:putative S-adenosyl-L-methionine-dependent methyltransferase [Lyophyllum shimeji]|uniref:S-adenosyl-L-methionine-dependent methyltransferase n=1 Tax=Lyophyllum shimeji TaxID=47721 RepID=A0A9P3PY90_LYOSH|nr:putative S-adenosyl-L-methionine-dependent methyltransferase [Lyophyllum shimeji]